MTATSLATVDNGTKEFFHIQHLHLFAGQCTFDEDDLPGRVVGGEVWYGGRDQLKLSNSREKCCGSGAMRTGPYVFSTRRSRSILKICRLV